ncbi:Myosin-M heavy chain [Vanrija pseudolonga]|nr:Myosin-M heavy chain [Vanrija pseudolonga]
MTLASPPPPLPPTLPPRTITCTTDGEDEGPTRTLWTQSVSRSKKMLRSKDSASSSSSRRRVNSAPPSPTTPAQTAFPGPRPDSPDFARSSSDHTHSSIEPRSSLEQLSSVERFSITDRSLDRHSLDRRSSYDRQSSVERRRSSVESTQSGPSIRVSENRRGVPRLSFANGVSSLLGPPLPSFDHNTPTTAGSARTITDSTPTSPRHLDGSLSSPTASEQSPISRKRRLNAIRGLVKTLNFEQPWSIVEKSDASGSDSVYWAQGGEPPQLSRLSLGHKFQAADLSSITPSNDSTVSLPPSQLPDAESDNRLRRTRKFSRSMVNVVENRDLDASNPAGWPVRPLSRGPEQWTERPISPPMGLAPLEKVKSLAAAAVAAASTQASPPRIVQRVNSVALKKKPSTTRLNAPAVPRQPPRPSRQRKESFAVAHSGYSKSLRPTTPLPFDDEDSAPSWRESLANDGVYKKIFESFDGPNEINRQEVMWELCETEAAFVRSCRDVLRLFVTPLRTPHGDWMSGVPPGACKLFESLEMITQTHADISTSLHRLRRRSNEILDVGDFVNQFGLWVARLACHEPYLVLFNPICQLIEESSRDDSSTFGEFLRMQTRDKALGSLSLGSMLLKPVQRLTKYPLFLKRLLDATPSSHPAHEAVVHLIDTTEVILATLQDTKGRSDDFQQLTALEATLDGLPAGFVLATHGRRLIDRSQVVRIFKDSAPTTPSLSRAGSVRSLRQTFGGGGSSAAPRASDSSTHTASSGHLETPSQGLWSTTPSSVASSIRSPSVRSSSRATSPIQQKDRPLTSVSRSPSFTSIMEKPISPPRSFGSIRKIRGEDALTLLVFNDMVLLAAPVSERPGFFRYKARKAEPVRFRVVAAADGGLGTVDDVREVSGWGNYSQAFALAVQAPSGRSTVATYALAPSSTLPRRAQRSPSLSAQLLETIEQVVGYIKATRSPASSTHTTDVDDDE